MGKPTGFLEYNRCEKQRISEKERIKNYNEFYNDLSEKERRRQGSRCMNCGVPLCQSALSLNGMVTGCPLHNLIPEWNDEIYNGNYMHAVSRLLKTSSFPEFTGRVCPALCEKACICGRDGDSVTIHDNELFIIETAFKNGWMKPRIPTSRTDKKIAVIGSGPSGLAVADMLNKRGHNITVYEREDRIGGLLMYGIPNMKLDKSVIDRRVKLMTDEGVNFVTGADIGNNISANEILSDYDAVVLCCGAKQARTLPAVTDTTDGVYFAVDFLTSATRKLLSQDIDYNNLQTAKDKNVIIVGGGDTGNDCVGTSIRQGCKSVTQIEMMPCPPLSRSESNPWPEWPRVLKTDYGQQEAIAVFGNDPRVYETTIKELVTKDGKLTGVKTVQVKFENENGKRVMKEIPGSEKNLDADMLLIAAGFTGCQKYVTDAFGVELTGRNTVKANTFSTSVPKVFVAGDMHRGQSLVVWAISEGRNCAVEVDRFLMGYTGLE